MESSHSGRLLLTAAAANAIPLGEGRTVHLGEHRVAVFRTRAGEIFAVQAECSHLGGPLADGITGAGRVTCPLHGYVFDLSTGEPLGHSCPALRTYPARVGELGELYLTDLSEPAGTVGCAG